MKYKIFYIGLNSETLVLLSNNESLKVIGVNYFEYFNDFTINPFDQIFRWSYSLYFNKKNKKLARFLFEIWNKFYFLSNNIYIDNKNYFYQILKNNIEVIDTENIDYFSSFIINNGIDLLVINSWGIIPNKIITLPKYGTMNIHPSILPQYRGALPTLWSLKNHDKQSALTYIALNQSIDDGIIINQHIFNIEEYDDWYKLEKKISLILNNTLINDVLSYLNNQYIPVKNNIQPSYTGFYTKYSEINLATESSVDIYNKVGLYPFIEPYFYCFLIILNKKIFIKKIFIYKKQIKDNIPRTMSLGLGFILFFTKDGILKARLFRDISFNNSIFIIFNKIIKRI